MNVLRTLSMEVRVHQQHVETSIVGVRDSTETLDPPRR